MKFGNIPTNVGGKSFPSRLEAGRYSELLILQKAGKLSGLETQTMFRLEVNGSLVCKYYADFTYTDERGNYVVEDTKGFLTPEFRIKAKLFEALNGYPISLIYAKPKRPKLGQRKAVRKA